MKRKNTSIVAFFTLCLSCWFCYMEYAQTIDMLTASGSSNNIICIQNDGTNKRIIKLLQNIHLILVACYGFTCLTVIICNCKLHAYVLLPYKPFIERDCLRLSVYCTIFNWLMCISFSAEKRCQPTEAYWNK